MSVGTNKRVVLRNLLHINSSIDTKQRASTTTGVLVQVSANLWPTTRRPKTRGTGAALPFQKRVQRAIGHISETNKTPERSRRSQLAAATVHTDDGSCLSMVPARVTLRYRSCSSTSHNGAFSNTTDMLQFNGGETIRKSSSETRTSSSPDNNGTAKEKLKLNRPNSRGKRRTPHINGLIPLERVSRDFETELPSVLDENITGTKLSLPTQRIKPQVKPTRGSVALKPLTSSDQVTNSLTYSTNYSTQKHVKSRSISGVPKPEPASTEEGDTTGQSWSHNPNVLPISKPILSQQNKNNNFSNDNSTNASSSLTATTILGKTENCSGTNSLTVTASSVGSSTSNPQRPHKPSQSHLTSTRAFGTSRKKSPGGDCLYADPVVGATPSFQSRLSELASLEAETVRYEKLKKLKKKSKERED